MYIVKTWQHKKSFHKQEINLVFVFNAYKCTANQKNIAAGIMKPPLENVARTFGTFEKQQSKNEIGQVATNVTTA